MIYSNDDRKDSILICRWVVLLILTSFKKSCVFKEIIAECIFICSSCV